MNIREVIAAVNQMQADGVIDRYAIGGAVGATFHLEPAGALDAARFQAILARHALVDAWRKFERQFLGDAP